LETTPEAGFVLQRKCAAKRALYRKYGSATLAPWSRERSFGAPSQYKSISSTTL
jgi:hypothetical protein